MAVLTCRKVKFVLKCIYVEIVVEMLIAELYMLDIVMKVLDSARDLLETHLLDILWTNKVDKLVVIWLFCFWNSQEKWICFFIFEIKGKIDMLR